MGVYDIAAAQRPAKPVTSFYEGKALRAGLRSEELRQQALEQDIELAPEYLDVERGKVRNTATRNAIDMVALNREIGEDGVAALQDAYASGLSAYEETEDPEVAFDIIAERLSMVDPEADPAEVRAMLYEQAGGNFDPQRVKAFLMDADEYRQRSRPKQSEPTSMQKEIEPLVERGVISREQADALYLEKGENAAAATEGTQKDRLVADIARMLGGDYDTAVKIGYGLIEMKQNPVTGMVELTDTVTGEAWEVPVQGKEAPIASPEPGRTLWELSQHATGLGSTAKAAYNVPAAWLGLPVSEKTAEARQTFRTTGQSFIRALAINPKFPVKEQERIRDEINVLPQVLDDPKLLRLRMQSIKNDLELRMDQAEADGNDTSLPRETRQQQKANARQIRNYLSVMGIPEAGGSAPPAALEYLRRNPDTAEQFRAKFGYLPEEFDGGS